MVSAWASKAGVSLGQLSSRMAKEEGEKKTTEQLLDCIEVAGNIITLDAMGATPSIVKKITQKKGDYVVAIKDNQRSVKKLGCMLFEKNEKKLHSLTTDEKGHGRHEKREYELLVLAEAQTLGMNQGIEEHLSRFEGAKSIGRVQCKRFADGQSSVETRYYLSSLTGVGEFAQAVREHWAIENCLHWQLDVTFREDHVRARMGQSAENLAIIRRLALNLLKQEKSENKSLRRKRNLCAWRKSYLLQVIFGSCAV